jgi:hypothetical protein
VFLQFKPAKIYYPRHVKPSKGGASSCHHMKEGGEGGQQSRKGGLCTVWSSVLCQSSHHILPIFPRGVPKSCLLYYPFLFWTSLLRKSLGRQRSSPWMTATTRSHPPWQLWRRYVRTSIGFEGIQFVAAALDRASACHVTGHAGWPSPCWPWRPATC